MQIMTSINVTINMKKHGQNILSNAHICMEADMQI